MPNLLPMVFIALVALALLMTLLWLWQSLRHAFLHALSVPQAARPIVSTARAALMAEKASLLMALRDLEAERESGKLSGEDFRQLNEQYRVRAREVLRELDALLSPHRQDAKALLDAAVSGKLESTLAPVTTQSAQGAAAPGCNACGAGNDVDAVFCKKCGARLRSEALA
jgi:hypothetical protein